MQKRIAVLITGATGIIYAYRLLKELSKMDSIETHLVISNAAAIVMKQEMGINEKEVASLADFNYGENNFMAPLASGSFKLDGAIVVPCSMKTLSAIANGYEQNLISRTAMATLKERKPLILMVRETPLNVIHLKNMLSVAEAGGIIMPPLPPFYFKIKNIDEMVDLTVGRVLDMLGIESSLMKQWSIDK